MKITALGKSVTRVESRRYRIAVLNAKGEAEYFLNSENELTIFEDKARLFWSLTSAEEAGRGMYGSLIRDRDWCIESVEMVVDRVKEIR